MNSDQANSEQPQADIPAGMDAAPVPTNGGAPAAAETAAQTQAAEYLDLLQRERANFINYRRRAEQERQEVQSYATAQLIKKLLPVVDDFERALAAAPDPATHPWVQGLALIERKLGALLESEGVTIIEALHHPFDPNLHEAVDYEAGEGEDIVADELTRGYRLRERVLRPAMVRVGKRKKDGA